MKVYHHKTYVKVSFPHREWIELTAEKQAELTALASRVEAYKFSQDLFFRPSAWSGIRPLIPGRRVWPLPRRRKV